MKFLKNKRLLLIVVGMILVIGIIFSMTIIKKTKNASVTNAFAPTPTAVVTPTTYKKIPPSNLDTSSWKEFSDKKLGFSLKYPPEVIIDARQTSQGRLTVFIFEDDKNKSLPGKVTSFYIADTHKKGIDGFTAFSRSDCGSKCDVSYKKTDWVNVNNAYGVKNPLPKDNNNYYLTDKKQTGTVINIYIGGYTNKKDKAVQDKITTFEEMIKTIKFDR